MVMIGAGKVDKQGRVLLPAGWRKGCKEVNCFYDVEWEVFCVMPIQDEEANRRVNGVARSSLPIAKVDGKGRISIPKCFLKKMRYPEEVEFVMGGYLEDKLIIYPVG